INMSDPVRPRKSMRFRGRSYIAFVLTPEVPVFEWLADLDEWIRRSAGFFVGKPVVLDLSAVPLGKDAIAHLIAERQPRGTRIMGSEGVRPSELGPELPPVLQGGRTAAAAAATEPPDAAALEKALPVAASSSTAEQPGSLLLENPVRSGQSVVFP